MWPRRGVGLGCQHRCLAPDTQRGLPFVSEPFPAGGPSSGVGGLSRLAACGPDGLQHTLTVLRAWSQPQTVLRLPFCLGPVHGRVGAVSFSASSPWDTAPAPKGAGVLPSPQPRLTFRIPRDPSRLLI